MNGWAFLREGIHPDLREDAPRAAALEGQALTLAAAAAQRAGRRIAPRDPEVLWQPQWWAPDWGPDDPETGEPVGALLGWDPDGSGRDPDAWSLRVVVHVEPEDG